MPNQLLMPPIVDGGTCSPGSIAFNPLAGSAATQDFKAVVFGDCTGNWQPPLAGAAFQAKGAAPVLIRFGRLRQSRRGGFRVPMTVVSEKPFSAVDLTFDYDPTSLGVVGVRTAVRLEGGLVAWNEVSPGRVSASFAVAPPLPAGTRRLLELDFQGERVIRARRSRGWISLRRVTVDEGEADLQIR